MSEKNTPAPPEERCCDGTVKTTEINSPPVVTGPDETVSLGAMCEYVHAPDCAHRSRPDYCKHETRIDDGRICWDCEDEHDAARDAEGLNPDGSLRPPAPLAEPSGCWIWTAARDKDGYGQVSRHDATARVHRVVYELLVGPVPKGMTLDHLCRMRACVNPAHLEPVTLHKNILRGDSPSARAARKTTCLRGHPFDAALRSDGSRRCRICERNRARDNYKKKVKHG